MADSTSQSVFIGWISRGLRVRDGHFHADGQHASNVSRSFFGVIHMTWVSATKTSSRCQVKAVFLTAHQAAQQRRIATCRAIVPELPHPFRASIHKHYR